VAEGTVPERTSDKAGKIELWPTKNQEGGKLLGTWFYQWVQ
jgi:hypothetical protein